MDITTQRTTGLPQSILKSPKNKNERATSAPAENSIYRVPGVFSTLASNERPATAPTGRRLPWAERRAALQSKDPALNDTQRFRKIPQIKMHADKAAEPAKKGRRTTKSVHFNETAYVMHDCDIKEKWYENALPYRLSDVYGPTVLAVCELNSDETSYYRENQYSSEVARPVLLEDTEQPNEARTSEGPEEIEEITPAEKSKAVEVPTLPERSEFSKVFSRSPSGRETEGKSVWWRHDAYESKWLALYSRAQRSDEGMKDLLDQNRDNVPLLELTEKTEVGNQLIPLQTAVSEMREFRDNEKHNFTFTDKKARKETRTPMEVYGPLRSALTSIQTSKRPSMKQLAIVLAEFALTAGSESDKSIADAGMEAIKKIIKTRKTLMRKYAPKA
jgi:hypothetical protein